MEQSHFWEANIDSGNIQPYVKSGGSLLYLQEPTAGPYP